jgi:hypothetical protein
MIPAPPPASWHKSPSLHSLQVPLTPTYTDPRSAPKPPSFSHSIRAAFHRAPSVRSGYSASTSSSDNHPYAQPRMAPIPGVSAHGAVDDDEECPVCLEPLSFSFRLPGEKPHIVPECGHALHEVRSRSSPLSFFSHRAGLLYCSIWTTSEPEQIGASQIECRSLRRL